MQAIYFILAAVHIVTLVITGILWTWLDIKPNPGLRAQFRNIRAVHFGSLYLLPWFLGLAYAFEKLQVPAFHQAVFPIGLGGLIFFSSLGYVFPRPAELDPFYYWTKGAAMWVSAIGLLILIVALLWTAAVLVVYSLGGTLPTM